MMARQIGRLAQPGEWGVHEIGHVKVVYCGRADNLGGYLIERRQWDALRDDEKAAVLSGFRVMDVGPEPIRCPTCGDVADDTEEKTFTYRVWCKRCGLGPVVRAPGGLLAPSAVA